MKKNENLIKKQTILCSLKDKVADSFGAPTSFVNENVAKRSFVDLLNTDGYKQHKSDYDLYLVGYYDCESGIISAVDNPKLIIGGGSLDS